MNLSPAIQIKAAQKVLFSLVSPNLFILLLTSQRLMELKTSKIFSINWGNMVVERTTIESHSVIFAVTFPG